MRFFFSAAAGGIEDFYRKKFNIQQRTNTIATDCDPSVASFKFCFGLMKLLTFHLKIHRRDSYYAL
jgi:hypothetical protein